MSDSQVFSDTLFGFVRPDSRLASTSQATTPRAPSLLEYQALQAEVVELRQRLKIADATIAEYETVLGGEVDEEQVIASEIDRFVEYLDTLIPVEIKKQFTLTELLKLKQVTRRMKAEVLIRDSETRGYDPLPEWYLILNR